MISKSQCVRDCKKAGGSLFTCIRKCFHKPPKPVRTSLYLSLFGATHCRSISIRDSHLDSITDTAARVFLDQDQLDKEQYVTEEFDCDDFADELWIRARRYFRNRGKNVEWGLVQATWSSGKLHRANLYRNTYGEIVFIEPQTDEIKPPASTYDWIIV